MEGREGKCGSEGGWEGVKVGGRVVGRVSGGGRVCGGGRVGGVGKWEGG